jgi:hypothetical protein
LRSGVFLFCPQGPNGPCGVGGRSARVLFVGCSSCSCSPFISIRRGFEFWLEVVSDSPQKRADGPRVPGGQSACSPRTVRFSGFATEGSVVFNGQSAAQAGRSAVPVRTVHATLADGPCGPCGQSAPPGRTVRQSLCDLLLCSIPPFPSCASACASRNRS